MQVKRLLGEWIELSIIRDLVRRVLFLFVGVGVGLSLSL